MKKLTTSLKTNNIHPVLILFLLLLLLGCASKDKHLRPQTTKILHIAHTRSKELGKIDHKVKQVNYDAFDVLCLGGDLDLFTSKNEETISNWDSLFHFGREETLWTLGNHDVSNLALVQKYTKRPPYYTWSKPPFLFLVLDSQSNKSKITGKQLEMVQNLADTISSSQYDYCIVLTHQLIWLYGKEALEDSMRFVPNAGFGTCGYCINPNNFYGDVYPELLKIKAKGIEVFCVAGDLGFKTTSFEYQTKEGIYLLASGMDVEKDNNKVLIFELEEGKPLEWRFEDI